MNLVHVEDAARIVVAALDHATAPRVFCVSDGHPVSRKDYYAKISQLLGAPPPSFLDDPDTPAAARAASSKRVSSARMAAELYGEWRYPSYAQGLAALLDAD